MSKTVIKDNSDKSVNDSTSISDVDSISENESIVSDLDVDDLLQQQVGGLRLQPTQVGPNSPPTSPIRIPHLPKQTRSGKNYSLLICKSSFDNL